jgi:hypothetical protein
MIRLSVLFGLLALPAMAQDNIGFASPSGNIACLIGAGFARCDISVMTHQDFTKPPANCPLDFGAAFQIESDGAKAVALCYGDTVFAPDLPVLDYSQVMSVGGIHCTSEKTGMRCANAAGHGFQIAKARQSLF